MNNINFLPSSAKAMADMDSGANTLQNPYSDTSSQFLDDLFDFIGWGSSRRAFERELYASNTAYQRAVADMQAAGLNPYLAYQQGGASTPSAYAAAGHLKDVIQLALTAFNLAGNSTTKAISLKNTINIIKRNIFITIIF